jgi:hypothetical protein
MLDGLSQGFTSRATSTAAKRADIAALIGNPVPREHERLRAWVSTAHAGQQSLPRAPGGRPP